MGLFGSLKTRARDGRLMAGLQAAQASLHGEHGTAARIQIAARERVAEREKEQASQRTSYQWARAQGYDEATARALANDPRTVSAMIAGMGRPAQPDTGGTDVARAPQTRVSPQPGVGRSGPWEPLQFLTDEEMARREQQRALRRPGFGDGFVGYPATAAVIRW